jgi:hypothetical protein
LAGFWHDGLCISHTDSIMLTCEAIYAFPLESGIWEIGWFSLLLLNITQYMRPEKWMGYKYGKWMDNIVIG